MDTELKLKKFDMSSNIDDKKIIFVGKRHTGISFFMNDLFDAFHLLTTLTSDTDFGVIEASFNKSKL